MTRIQLRRDTSSNWQTNNPTPSLGEPCYETDTKKLKIGDGVTKYNDLQYFTGSGGGTEDYTQLTNKPQINGIELTGNQDGTTLGLANSSEIEELGNKLNQLANDVTNLDTNKQNKLTAVAPISINKYTKSNLVGFSYTGNSEGLYSTDGVYARNDKLISRSGGYGILKDCTVVDIDLTWKSYIDIPYEIGQIVKCPAAGAQYYDYSFHIFGNIQPDNTFDLIANIDTIFKNSRIIPNDAVVNRAGSYLVCNTVQRVSGSQESLDTVLDKDEYVSYIQIYEDNQGAIYVESFGCTGVSGDSPFYTTTRYKVTDTESINRLKQINTIRLYPMIYGKGGRDLDTAFDIANVGLFSIDKELYSLNNDMTEIENADNLFNLSGQTSRNYLEIQVDGTTITTNSSGQLQANIPSNLTTQGNTFNGASQLVQLDGDGKLPAIDGSQLTNLPAGEIPTNMVTTDTVQNITTVKTFVGNSPVRIKNTNINKIATPFRLWQSSLAGNKIFIGDCPDSGFSTSGLPVAIIVPNTDKNIYKANTGDLNTFVPILDGENFSSVAPTGNLKYWTGTSADYTNVTTKDMDTLYRTTDTNEVYLGTIKLGGNSGSN